MLYREYGVHCCTFTYPYCHTHTCAFELTKVFFSLQVYVGGNLTFNIGKLVFEDSGPLLLPLPIIIVIAACGLVLIAIIIGVFIAYYHKSQESSRVMRRMQNQMDILEARVAKECKEGWCLVCWYLLSVYNEEACLTEIVHWAIVHLVIYLSISSIVVMTTDQVSQQQ